MNMETYELSIRSSVHRDAFGSAKEKRIVSHCNI